MIEDIVATDTETQVFEFIYAIQDGDYDKAMGIMKRALYRRTVDKHQYVALYDIVGIIKPSFALLKR